jgi:hypothetical protein
MGGGNVEHLWYGLCLFKATITLFVVSVAVLLCKRFVRPIPWNSVIRRWTKYKEARLVGTLPPPPNFDASQSRSADRSPNEGRGGYPEALKPPNGARGSG